LIAAAILLQPARSTAAKPAAQSFSAFARTLAEAASHDDRRAIAGMVHYPIKVVASGWIIPVGDRATFVKYFDAFFTPEIRDLIDEATRRPRSARPDEVITLGKDAVRIMRFGGEYKIIGIAVPAPSGRVHAARRGTTRVQFATGQSTAGFSGTLAANERETYLLHARRNDLVDIRIDGVHGKDIVARIIDARTGTPVDARADGTRVWVGRVPADGDYRLEVVRLATGGDSVLTYTLLVSVRTLNR